MKKTVKKNKQRPVSNVMVHVITKPIYAQYIPVLTNVRWDILNDNGIDIPDQSLHVGNLKVGVLAAWYDGDLVHVGWSRCNYTHGDDWNEQLARKMAIGRAKSASVKGSIPDSFRKYLKKFFERVQERWGTTNIVVGNETHTNLADFFKSSAKVQPKTDGQRLLADSAKAAKMGS